MPYREISGDIPEVIANGERLYEGDLAGYFRVLFFEATNLTNPYHNLRHSLHVAWLCHQACRFYRDTITPRQMRILLIAALFHDFDHPGHPHSDAEEPDRLNIDIAVAGLRRHIEPGDRALLPDIEKLIRLTQFPYAAGGDTLDLLGQIIRDADVAQGLDPVWIQQVVIGLAAEQGLAPLQMLRAQEPFLRRLSFNTEWARTLYPRELIDQKIEEARKLLRLLEPESVAAV